MRHYNDHPCESCSAEHCDKCDFSKHPSPVLHRKAAEHVTPETVDVDEFEAEQDRHERNIQEIQEMLVRDDVTDFTIGH